MEPYPASPNSGRPREPARNYRPPNHALLRLAFKFLCVVALSRANLEHWGDTVTEQERWKKHSKAIVNRFHNANLTAGLVLTTTAVLLTSHPALALLMDYDSPASYSFALAAFGAALLSVLFGVTVLAIYETGTAHYNMQVLTKLARYQVILLLLGLACPSIYLATATICMYISILIACLRTGNIVVHVIMALSFSVFFINGVFMLYVLINVGGEFESATEV